MCAICLACVMCAMFVLCVLCVCVYAQMCVRMPDARVVPDVSDVRNVCGMSDV